MSEKKFGKFGGMKIMTNYLTSLNITSLEDVIKTLKNLNGENNDMTPYINTVEFLEKMTRHEFDADTEEYVVCDVCEGDDEECENCDGEGYVWEDLSPEQWLLNEFNEGHMERVSCDNSYNWGSPLLNDIDYSEYLNTRTNEKFVELKVHLGGDIRGNYTPNMWFACGLRSMLDVLSDTMKICTYEIDGQEYDVRIIPTSDVADIYNEDGDHVGEVCPCDLDCENPVSVIEEIIKENM